VSGAAEGIVRRYFREAWEEAEPAAIDALLAPDYVDRDPPPGAGATRAEQRRIVEQLRVATRDRSIRIIALYACGDFVTVRHDTSWTQIGPLFGLQGDGRRVLVRGCDLHRLAGGRIVESWHVESLRSAVD